LCGVLARHPGACITHLHALSHADAAADASPLREVRRATRPRGSGRSARRAVRHVRGLAGVARDRGLRLRIRAGGPGRGPRPQVRSLAPEARSILGLGGWPVRTALVPVPLSSARLRERGFNQALDLALPLGGQTGLPVLPVLRRRAGGGRQAGAGRTFRRENVEGRFAACPVDRTEAAILVDDVLTTGATAFACADALAQAGFTRIAVITFARTSRAIDARASQRGRRIGRLRVVGRSSSRAGPPARERGGASARAFLESSTGDAMSEASR